MVCLLKIEYWPFSVTWKTIIIRTLNSKRRCMQRLYKLSESRFTGFKDFEDKSLIFGERGLTIMRAVRQAKRVGSFWWSSFFAYFFSNGKSMKKKWKINIVGDALLKHQQWQRDCFVPRNDGSTINKCLNCGERGTDNKPGRASGLVGG